MIRPAILASVLLLAGGLGASAQSAKVGSDDTLLQPGQFKIGNYSPRCGSVPTLISEDLPVGGAALTALGENGTVRLIVINPDNLKRTSEETKLFVYAHECGHHIMGQSEVVADCYASMRGRQEGWLTEKRLDRVCRNRYIGHKSSRRYPPGTLRCRIQRYCFAAAANTRNLSPANVNRVAKAALERVLPVAENYLRAEQSER